MIYFEYESEMIKFMYEVKYSKTKYNFQRHVDEINYIKKFRKRMITWAWSCMDLMKQCCEMAKSAIAVGGGVALFMIIYIFG